MSGTIFDLIEEEIPRLRRFARYLVRDADRADDVVQECLVRAVDKASAWPPGTNLRTSLLAILHHCRADEMRRTGHRQVVDDAEPNGPLPGILEGQELRVTLAEIRDAFMRLKEEHREILLLVVVEDLDHQEAAGILGIPVGTVRSRLSSAREALRGASAARQGLPTAATAR